MTRLYRLDATARALGDAFEARVGEDPWAGGYIAPEKFAPVIIAARDFIAGGRPSASRLAARLVPRLWGVAPPPLADSASGRILSVRNPESPFWIGHLRNSEFRCLIPATSVMVWGSATDYEGRRLRHWFALDGTPIFALLGVWKDEEVPAFAVISAKPTGAAKACGAKAMPMALSPRSQAADIWLHGGWDQARALMEARASEDWAEIGES
ncbi:MAG: DUF159 family protein [Pseudomonadota bacterium]